MELKPEIVEQIFDVNRLPSVGEKKKSPKENNSLLTHILSPVSHVRINTGEKSIEQND